MRKLVNSSQSSQPRERLINLGPEVLSDAELLASILYSGSKSQNVLELSVQILRSLDSTQQLSSIGYATLTKIKGLGKAKSCALLAAVELGKRLYIGGNEPKMEALTTPSAVFDLIKPYTYGLRKENLFVISTNSRSKCISIDHVTKGTVDSTIAHPRDLLAYPIMAGATGFFIVHNHPSGDSYPSEEDIELTANINKLSDKLGMKLIDHIVVTNESYFSIKSLNIFDEENK